MRYEQPRMELISFDAEDIVTLSGQGVGGSEGEYFPGVDAF